MRGDIWFSKEWVTDNVYVVNDHNMTFEPITGQQCFIIGHHLKDLEIIEQGARKLVNNDFKYFNIFGKRATLWKNAIQKQTKDPNIIIEASEIANLEMAYNLAYYSTKHPEKTNFIISDDEYFTDYLLTDFERILNNVTRVTLEDWIAFKSGFEFKYNGKDAVVSVVYGDILIGYFGKLKRFDTISEAFDAKIFERKSLRRIVNEVMGREEE